MIKRICKSLLATASLIAAILAVLAIADKDWPQVCAWLLLDISATLTSVTWDDL